MTSAVSLRVRCPSCGEWGQLQLDYPTDGAVTDARCEPEVVSFACPNQNVEGHQPPAHDDLRGLVPDDLAVPDSRAE
jgi:hypothetical protein